MIKFILLFAFVMITGFSNAQCISTHSKRLTGNWQFLKQDLGGVWEAVRTASSGSPETVPLWTDVTLPHCFNAEDAVDPDVNYYQGAGWYRTSIEVNNPFPHGRTFLHFEGAGQKTEVYIGFDKVGSHVGGYDEWTVDITDILKKSFNEILTKKYKGKIPLSIRCDNSRDLEMIPSDLSDFNVYGGLYRYVNLVYVPESYINRVHVEARMTKKNSGTVNLDVSLLNSSGRNMELKLEVKDSQNEIVFENKLSTLSNQLKYKFQLNKIKRWSPSNPVLYSLSITTTGENGGQVYTDKFGFRDFTFESNGPFYLNGERLLLKGTHRHEDFSGVAAAMTEDMIRREMQMMKDMGVNFIRLAHYQQSRIVLNLCDSLGILVWEEIPWCRGGLGGGVYKAQARRMLTHMINQHYNHPAVIIWGLGNENDWPGDFPEFDKQKIRTFMKDLNNLAHQLDAERKTAIRRCDFCKYIVDVYSPSIWAGWYRGKFTEYKRVSHENMLEVTHFLHAEWGGSSHAGRHDEAPDRGLENVKAGDGADERAGDASLVGGDARVSRDGNWSETYICNLFDWHLKEQETMPWLTGAAQWAFKDFSTPVRPENPIPYMNQKGVVERDLTPKEGYFVFQSYWTEKPMVHIYGHSWRTRWGDEGQKKLVKVYSNCNEVELFLNGKSMGKKNRDSQDFPAAGLHWNVQFKKGKNKLLAVSKGKGEKIRDEINLVYQTEKWDEAARLVMSEIPIDDDHSWLKVKALDKNGVLCLDARNRIRFSVAGEARLIKNKGTVNGSSVVELCNGVAKIKIEKLGSIYSAVVISEGLKSVVIK